jgi:hypothetical protein
VIELSAGGLSVGFQLERSPAAGGSGGRRLRIAAASAGVLAAVLLNGATTANANLVTNGSFESTTAGDSSGVPSQVTNSNLTGWSISGGGGAPYDFVVMNGNSGFYNGYASSSVTYGPNPGESPDGGNYIAANADDNVGVLSQSIGGLNANATYAVTFYESEATTFGSDYTGYWTVSFGSTTKNSTSMPTTTGGSTWISDTIDFTATASTQLLSFVAGDTSGAPPFILLDGVSVSQVPEPATLGLAAVGIAGLAAFRRWRRNRPTPGADDRAD